MAVTQAQLAAAVNATLADPSLHIDAVTIGRYLNRKLNPLSPPADGEDLAKWAAKAQRWRHENLKRPGPKPRIARGRVGELERAELRKKKAEATLREIDVEERKGKLHSVPECEALQVQRYQAVAHAFAGFARSVARRVSLLPADEAELVLDDEVRRRLEIIAPREAGNLDAGTP